MNESYFHNTKIIDPGKDLSGYNWSINATGGVYPASGAIQPDTHYGVDISARRNPISCKG